MSNLKAMRLKTGLSQSKLAKLSGVNIRMIQQYEQGAKNINNAAALTIYHLSTVLNCKMEDLIERKGVDKNDKNL